MATQHPDNAAAPYWEQDGDGFVSTKEEIRESVSAFRDLNCEEFMWDWEGKYVDEGVIDKMFSEYHAYFKRQQLGRDKFLTFRIPNIWREKGYGLARAMMGILTAESFARDLEFHTPPLFEVILPMTVKAENIIYIQNTFAKLAKFKNKLFNENSNFDYLNVWPLIEGIDNLLQSRALLDDYLKLHLASFKGQPAYLRLHIARSDPALNAGLVAAVVAGKVALSEFHRFGQDHGIKIYPAIGVGTLPFRGSLSPERINDFLAEYSGMRTVYIQSAFRYDFDLRVVKKAIKKLNEKLPTTPIKIYQRRELSEAAEICQIFSKPYQQTVEPLAGLINKLAEQVPTRRERKLHVGLFGYSRALGKKRLPRAIPFTAVLYSLGVPPEFIGTGRGLVQLAKRGIKLEKYYLNFKKDLSLAGEFLNKENLIKLAKTKKAWAQVLDDVEILEQYFGLEFGPKSSKAKKHLALSSKFYTDWRRGKKLGANIIASGKLRQSLG